MVHCIHNNQNTKKENYIDVVNEELQQEMMLLSTKDNEEVNNSKLETITKLDKAATEKKLKSEAFSVLTYDQVKRLHHVMEQVVPIHNNNIHSNFPTLEIKLKDLVKIVRTKLENEQSIKVNDIRLNGGAASYVLSPENSSYNDLDLIFAVDLSDQKTYDKIRTAVLDSLLDFLPEGTNRCRLSASLLKDVYIHKMIKVCEKDKWSLISLSNNQGRNVELKFVDTMKRQFEFSVDSFHIILDSLMLFYECSEMPISENIYPNVLCLSVYGNFNEAFSHLENKLIMTSNPEEIRGGGLLKYISLLIRNYQPANSEIKNLERYMCSRFFIDFSELPQQKAKLESYLANHFNGDSLTKTQYLIKLYKVVDESTVCLMGHERRQTLALIEEMAYRFYVRSQQQSQHQNHPFQPQTNQQFFPHFHHHHQIIRPHYDLMLATQQQTQQQSNNNNKSVNQNLNSSNNSTSSITSTNSTNSNKDNNSNNQINAVSSNQQTNHSNQQNKNQQNQKSQHIQQYHAYLFGNNTFNVHSMYYNNNPYHLHNYQTQFNHSCQCGGWIGTLSSPCA